MSRKHFIALADAVKEISNPQERERAARASPMSAPRKQQFRPGAVSPRVRV